MADYSSIGALQGFLNPGSDIGGFIQQVENVGINRQREQRAEEAHDMKLQMDSANLIAKYQDIEKTGMELEVTKAEQAGKLADVEVSNKLAEERVNLIPNMTQAQRNTWKTRVASTAQQLDNTQKQAVFSAVGGIYDKQSFDQAVMNLEQNGINPADVGMPEAYDPNTLTQYKQAIKTSLVANQKVAESEVLANVEREQQSILNDQQNAFTKAQNKFDWENRFKLKQMEIGAARQRAISTGTKNAVKRTDYKDVDLDDAITLLTKPVMAMGEKYINREWIGEDKLTAKGKALVTEIVRKAKAKWSADMISYEQSGGNPNLIPNTIWHNIETSVNNGGISQTAEELGVESIMNTRDFKNNPDIQALPKELQYEQARQAWLIQQQMSGTQQ